MNRSSHSRWRTPAGLGCALAMTIALHGCQGAKESQHDDERLPAVTARIETLAATEVPETYEAAGSTISELDASIASKVMAKVNQVLVREGDQVRPGQLLVQLDTRDLAAAVGVASSNLAASRTGVRAAATALDMERSTSQARIHQARAGLSQAQSALKAAKAQLDLALAGPRPQEREQARLAVQLAAANLKRAESDLRRIEMLVKEGALAQRDLDVARNAHEVARAQHESAIQGERMAAEGTRSEDIRTAQEAVRQAEGAVRAAEASVRQSEAAAKQVSLRKEEVAGAKAQVGQSGAALQMAQVNLSYGRVAAPFAGMITRRSADPGTMATPGMPLLQIEGGKRFLEVLVPESVISKIRPGMRADVALDAVGDGTRAGWITEIVPAGSQGSHSFRVKVEIRDSDGIKSGMFGRAFLPTGTSERLMIDQASTWAREGLHYVFAVDKEKIARLRIVTLGKRQGGEVEVLSGLVSGERVVTSDLDKVRDGNPIQER